MDLQVRAAAGPGGTRPFVRPPFPRHSLGDYWLSSIVFGLYGLRRPFLRDAAARVVNPLSYPRLTEYQLAFELLGPLQGMTVLDVGSPKLPALLFARDGGITLYSTDIRDYFIGPTAHLLERAGLGATLGTSVHLRTEDARALSFGDNSVEALYSISVVEHIPDDGDSEALREFARVLKPGGRLVLTVPYSSTGYSEEWIAADVYERQYAGERVFYQRHYDDESLERRLVSPSGLQMEQMVYFGEPHVRVERYWNRVPMKFKVPLLWAQPFVARLLFRPLRPAQKRHACGVALLLTKRA